MMVMLVKDIYFVDYNNNIVDLRKGQKVFVCIADHVAYTNGVHFDISPCEFKVLN